MENLKLEFGAGGASERPGYKTVDIRPEPGVDYVCPAWQINSHIEDNTVHEIYSRHFFEHLTFQQGRVVLDQWYNILVPGGLIEMMLPNMDLHIAQFQADPTHEHGLAGIYGWQRGVFDDTWDCHKSGYNWTSLHKLLKQHGSDNIVNHKKPLHKHLHVSARKPR